MQLSNRVTLPKNTPHNSDYVDCSVLPGNGILAKISRLHRYTGHRPRQCSGWLTPNLLSGLDLTEIDSYCTD
jgi:hypothetical protein